MYYFYMLWVKNHQYETKNFNEKFFDPFFNINFKRDLEQAKIIEDKYILQVF